MPKALTPQECFYTARAIARERAPYLQAALLMLIVRECKGLGTFGVTDEGFLLVDYDVFVQGAIPGMTAWTPEQGAAALIHEVNHFLREHGDRRKSCHAEPWLWNLAGDMEINDDIVEEQHTIKEHGRDVTVKKWELPPGCVVPSTFGQPDGRTAEEYYRAIFQQAQQQAQQMQAGGTGKGGNVANAPTKPNSPAESGTGKGWCGSMAGHKLPNEPKSGEGNGSDPKENQQNQPGEQPVHGRSPADLERIRNQVARDVEEHVKQKGSCPAGLQRWAAQRLKPPKVQWATKLARGLRNGRGMAKGMADFTYRKPSRRQGAFGYGEGAPILPALVAPKPVVCVLMDTSGSMSDTDVARGLSECHGILRALEAQVHFVVCDAMVHGIKQVKTWQDAAKLLKGGGGSNFIPAFEEIERLKPRPQVIVAVTDGMIDVPTRPPHGMKVIWLIVGKQYSAPAVWGEEIKVEAA